MTIFLFISEFARKLLFLYADGWRRARELGAIVRGLILSIPDEDQAQAWRFVSAIAYLYGGF